MTGESSQLSFVCTLIIECNHGNAHRRWPTPRQAKVSNKLMRESEREVQNSLRVLGKEGKGVKRTGERSISMFT